MRPRPYGGTHRRKEKDMARGKGFVKPGAKCASGYKKRKVRIKGRGMRTMCVRRK